MYKSTVKSIKDHIAFYSQHNFLLDRQIRKIGEADKLSAEEGRAIAERQAMTLIRYAAAHSKFYKDLYLGIDLSAPFEEVYPQLPVIRKADVRAGELDILTSSGSLLKKAYTSGTSGSPLTVYRSASSRIIESAYVWYFKMNHGLQPGDPVVSMRGVLDSSTIHYMNKSENTLYLSSYQLSKANIQKYIKLLRSFKPKAIWAFPSSVFTLANLLQDAGADLDIPLIFTSSETLYPFQREKIESVLHSRIYDWYGNSERSIALGQCEDGNYHELPLYSINDFSERGVVTTSLINKAFPLIKYYVDDTFQLKAGACTCGKEKTISALEGRVDDVVLLEDGTTVGRLGVSFQGIENLQYAQILQDQVSAITVNLVTNPAFSEKDCSLLESKLRQRLNNQLKITFNKVEEKDIIKTKAGKYKLIVSTLNPNNRIAV